MRHYASTHIRLFLCKARGTVLLEAGPRKSRDAYCLLCHKHWMTFGGVFKHP